jgi:antitoxin HigA-1
MYDPAHPGEVIRELCLEPLTLSVTEAAAALGITRKALSEVLNGRAGVSPAMALRLAKAFNTSAERWLALQQQYDLWQARRTVKLGRVRRLVESRRADKLPEGSVAKRHITRGARPACRCHTLANNSTLTGFFDDLRDVDVREY